MGNANTAKRHQISLPNLTTDKNHETSSGHLTRISPLPTNPIRCYNAPWGYTQSSPAFFQHHISTIFTAHHHQQSQTPDGTLLQSHNSMSSRHVQSFSTIHSDLLSLILVTFATSHWLRSPLKAEAEENTVARQEGRLHSQSTRKKRRRKEENPDQNALTAQRNQHLLQTTYSTRFTNPNPRVNLLQSQDHVQVTLRRPQTYLST